MPFSGQPIYAYEAAGKNGDLGLVWMMGQVYPLVKTKICDMCTIMYVSYVLSVIIIIIIIIIIKKNM